jgi:carbohydrate-selective porin OprB
MAGEKGDNALEAIFEGGRELRGFAGSARRARTQKHGALREDQRRILDEDGVGKSF